MFIFDGLKEVIERIFAVFFDANYQSCCVYLANGIAHKVKFPDRKKICDIFKSICRAGEPRTERIGAKSLYRRVKNRLSNSDEIVRIHTLYLRFL